MLNTLEEAIIIATQAHKGQVDKGGAPYILHPLRVMTHMRTNDEMIAAVLHDVVEDTPWSLSDLARYFPYWIIEAVDVLTRQENQSYEEYIERVSWNQTAIEVKKMDLIDNLNLTRLPEITEKDRERETKYRKALDTLLQVDRFRFVGDVR